MDRVEVQRKFQSWFKQYRYGILVVAIGIFLMMLPSKSEPVEHKETTLPEAPAALSVSEELSQILSQIQGVGKVQVMITEATGAETIYQTDLDRTQSTDSTTHREDTVVISNHDSDAGLIKTVTPPTYLGAIVVCQGGGDPAVRLAVSQAVSAVTGISTDRITVLKMK